MKEIIAYQTSDGEIHTSLKQAEYRENAITTGKLNLELDEFIKSVFNDEILSDKELVFIKSNIVKIGRIVNFRKELGLKYGINI